MREAQNGARIANAVLLTSDLNEAICRSEIAGIRCGIATVQRLYPEVRADSIDVAGGLVAFTGIDSPLSQAYGLAASVPLAGNEIARVSEFYETRGAIPRVFTTPFSDPALARGLAAAGYVPAENENVLAADAVDAEGARDPRVTVARDFDAWAHASACAFMDRTVLAPGDESIALILASSEGVIPVEGREGDEIVATAAMDLRGGCAAFFAGSTMPVRRGRGWHLALIRDRIARARELGARLLRATARAGSPSERNFRRCGFSTLYTRTLWERKAQ